MSKGQMTNTENWQNDSIQFARLLSEMLATVDFTTRQREALCASMDLAWADICEVLDRADDVWQDIKQRTTGGEFVPDRWAQASAALRDEHPWCGWTVAFSHGSDWDTTAFGLERLLKLNVLLTTADGRSRPVNIIEWQQIDPAYTAASDAAHAANAQPPSCDRVCGIGVQELDTEHYKPLDASQTELVPYEDIREIVVY